jgi:hypothetical protein
MRAAVLTLLVLLTGIPSAPAQTGLFQPSLLDRPDVKKAIDSIDGRAAAIVDEWIKIVEIPSPSK